MTMDRNDEVTIKMEESDRCYGIYIV